MKSRLTPQYITLIQNALLKSFWRERAFKVFLKSCNTPEKFIDSWQEEELKEEFIERIFKQLLVEEKGREVILKIAKFLMYQNNFPDLEHLLDADLRIQIAKEAVGRLKDFHKKQEEELYNYRLAQKAKMEFTKRQQKITRTLKSLQNFTEKLTELSKTIDHEISSIRFQDWFFELLDFYEIKNHKHYNQAGIETNGWFLFDNISYLVGIKFSAGRTSVIDIDHFYQEVISNPNCDMGLFLSISGYSKLAIEEASGDKTPIILIDHNHIYLALSGIMEFPDLIKKITRYTIESGRSYLSTEQFNR
ncbi:MAG: hypothetical protein JW996_04810 [Candidatus Cloacimonetes bacterium]|nr:hypothetical protein [Candidatus Cloacimonadota bacterium]